MTSNGKQTCMIPIQNQPIIDNKLYIEKEYMLFKLLK